MHSSTYGSLTQQSLHDVAPSAADAQPSSTRTLIRTHSRAIATAVVLLASIIAACAPPAERNQNFRLRKMLKAGWQIARGEDASTVLARQYPGFDIGTPLFLAVAMRMSTSADELAKGPPDRAPALYHLMHRAGFALAVTMMFAALLHLTTPFVAAAIAALILISPNWRFIAYSDDVYVFPMYALAAALAAIAALGARRRVAWPTLIGCAAVIGVSCIFRNVSVLCLAGLFVVAAFPSTFFTNELRRRIRIRAFATIILAIVSGAAPGFLVKSTGHVFWHPMHCGLAEFGGHEDAQARLIPWFVPAKDLPDDVTPINDWSDERSYRRARAAIPGVIPCSAEYDALMRDDYIDVWRRYPIGMLRTYAHRLANVLTLNPWQSHTTDSRIIASPFDAVAFALLIGLAVIAWRSRLPARNWMLTMAFAPMLVAPLIAHSGYIMYNAPARLPLYIFALCTLQHLCRSLRAPNVSSV
ncbi:MAG: hypothetical protein H6818_02170 [Phycisphaerales bacterium]|nr:hypothetical protein [Phycisphaerales bacterium]MCB9863119.1 hypothetical protein [Phycisphaerales bacterium]